MASLFNKNKKETVVEQPKTETKKLDRKAPVNVNKTFSNEIKKELRKNNIDFECVDKGDYETLRIPPEYQTFVSKIIRECEADYLNRKLDNKVSSAENNNKKAEKESFYFKIDEFLLDEFKDILDSKNLNYRIVKDKKGILYVEFEDEEYGEFIESTYSALLTKVANSGVENKEKNTDKNKKVSKKSLGRTEQLKARFTPEELKMIQERINTSGKSQGEFIREMLLNGFVKTRPSSTGDMYIRDRLSEIQSQLGKLSGSMVKIMQQTKENSNLSKEEREELQAAINGMKKVKSDIQKELKDVWH